MTDRDYSTADALNALSVADTDPYAVDRRRFLQLVGMGLGTGLLASAPSSLLESLIPGHRAMVGAAGPIGPTDGILVVIGMFGGNDGLNTVVPFDDGDYYRQHGRLAIAGADTLPIGGSAGLNPALTRFKQFWDDGQLAIVEGVGYEAPDLSHFNSMAYWMAGRPHAVPTTGWLGRWLDGYLADATDLYAAAEIGTSVPLHLIGRDRRGTAVPTSKPTFGASSEPNDLRVYDAIRGMQTAVHGRWHGSVSQALVDQLDLNKTLAPVIPGAEDLPDDKLASRLEIAARLINANLGFRVLTAGWGDFDSHAGQPTQHSNRMQELNAAVTRFFDILDPAWSSRVTVMTFSEFGRTSWDNDGLGTDHGTSAPHLVFGQNVKGGFYGQRPSLAGLRRWDRMAHHVDFRSYYASVLDGWLGGGSSDILGGQFEDLGLFRRGPGVNPDGTVAPGPAVVTAPSGLVAIAPARIVDTRNGHGVASSRPLGAGERLRVPVRGVAGVPGSGVSAVVANVTAVGATSPTYFTVYPGSTARPDTSNLNPVPGRAVPNLVVMAVGDDGCIDVFNAYGTADCVIDVFGYFVPDQGDRFVPLTPTRLFDTRSGSGVREGKLAHLSSVDFQVTGRSGVPTTGVTAVVLNLTATETESAGFLRVTPTGSVPAETSNVNFEAGDTVPNLVITKLGSGGKISLDSAGRATHALADVFGYFGPGGGLLRATPPRRILDTRSGIGSSRAPIGPTRSLELAVSGHGSVPSEATSVILNVTVTNVAAPSYVTVWPGGQSQPGTSNLNVVPGRTAANLVICGLGDAGGVSIANALSTCDVIADVLGYFVG